VFCRFQERWLPYLLEGFGHNPTFSLTVPAMALPYEDLTSRLVESHTVQCWYTRKLFFGAYYIPQVCSMTNIDSIYCIVCNLIVNSNILVLILTRICGMIYVLSAISHNSLDFDLLSVDLCLTGAKGKCTTAWTTGLALK
jgi:hypothetical protein